MKSHWLVEAEGLLTDVHDNTMDWPDTELRYRLSLANTMCLAAIAETLGKLVDELRRK